MLRATPFWPLLLSAVLSIGCATVRPLLTREAGRPAAEPALNANWLRVQPTLATRSETAPAFNLDRPEAAPAYSLDRPKAAPSRELASGPIQTGAASYYHPSLDGRMTANGETFDNGALTAASLTLRFGTRVRVTNLVNSKSVVVTINDRGPYVRGRIIDLTHRAALALGFVQRGVTRVRVEPLL
jgi:rare lipoprotein A